MMYEVPLLSRFSLALPLVPAMPEGESSFSDSRSCQAVDCFESRSRREAPSPRRVFAAGDLNGDGRPELVEQRVGELRAHFFSDDLGEVVEVPLQCPEGEEQGWVLKGVFRTSPGAKESYLVFQNDDEIVLRRCDGTELKEGVSLGIGGKFHEVVGFCDFLGRDREDIVCRRDDGSLCIFIMDGLAVKEVRHFPDSVAVPEGWNVVGAGRFHSSALGGPLGDAYTDLVLQHRDGTRKVALFEGTALQSEHVIWHGGMSDDDALVAVADMDGDGNGDLVCEKANGSVYVVLMEGLQRRAVVPVIGPCQEEDWILR
ncbi:MAG: FG-GAP repeat domain-containing protein [Vulcanimicrobiota bacterium]